MTDDLGSFCSRLVPKNPPEPCGVRRDIYRVTLDGRETVLCTKHMLECWKDAESDAVKI